MNIPADSFSLQDHLDKVYSTSLRKFAFSARTLKDYSIWQTTFRTELTRLLCLENHLPASLAVESIQSIDRDSYIEEKLSLDVGERIWDGMCAATWLLSRKDLVGGLGCTGQSGGGTTTLWLSALDERITTVVVSGYFNSFHGSILAMEHCECNYIPHILELAEMGDIAALIAPRPFCAINGEKDDIYPVAFAHEQFETVRRAYELHSASKACELKIHPGVHGYNNAMSQSWFSDWMKTTPKE